MSSSANKPANSRKNRDTESLYKPGQLSKWFFVTSLLLLVSWVLMLWKDYARPWKDYQARFYETMLRIEHEGEAQSQIDQDAQIGTEIGEAQAAVQSVEAKFKQQGTFKQLQDMRDELHALGKDAFLADSQFKGIKGDHAVAKYQFEMARLYQEDLAKEGADSGKIASAKKATEAKREALNTLAHQWDVKRRESESLIVKVDQLKRKIAGTEQELVDAKKALAALEVPVTTQRSKVEGLEAKYENNQWRNAPFIDFISPTIKIEQVVLEDIHDNWNFATARKVDRCMTCHAGIDMPVFGDRRITDNPNFKVESYMKAHSHLGMIMGVSSPHPMSQIGCTVCHHGVGWAVDFARSSHTPANPAERERWVDEHDWYKAKYIDYPMLPLEYTQGMCQKCHKQGMYDPIGYDESLDHGFIRDAVVSVNDHGTKIDRQVFAQRAKINDPSAEGFDDPVGNPVLPPHQVNQWGQWQMPSAPTPVGDASFPNPSSFQVTQETHDRLAAFNESDRHPDFTHDAMTTSWGWSAERYWQGYDTVVTYGCQGCHTIKDFGQQVGYDKPPRVAPDLTYIADKVQAAWLPLWIKHPDGYRPDTKMPSFYYFMRKNAYWEYEAGADGARLPPLAVLDAHMADPNDDLETNYQTVLGPISRPQDHARWSVEILAQTQYLMNQRNPATGSLRSRADPSDPQFSELYVNEPPPGDTGRGRELVNAVGCAGCHVLPEIKTRDGSFEPDGPARFDYDPLVMRGPRITSLGSKIKSRKWLNAWLADPRHYTATTRMPNMRLDDQERADVVDYLLSFKDDVFDQMDAPGFKPEYVDTVKDMYVEFFSKSSNGALKNPLSVEGEIGDLTNENRLATVLSMIGERLLARNGCFGCHAVGGHEDDQPIGTELTKEGIKNLHMLDFGRVPKYVKTEDGEKVDVLPHTRHGFIRTKITYPRLFDYSKQLIWQDKLRMPRFNFRMDDDLWKLRRDVSLAKLAEMPENLTEGDPAWGDYFEKRATRAAVAGVVLGLVDEPIKPGALFTPDQFQKDVIDGRRVAKRYGCNNCHTLEGKRGYLWGLKFDEGADRGTLPPNLFTQGWRTRDEWLMKFLQEPEFLRPIVEVHMPQFGLSDVEADALVKYFKRLAGRAREMGTYNPDSGLTGHDYGKPIQIKTGKKVLETRSAIEEAEHLFNTINCNKCHLPPEHPLAGDDGGVAPAFDHARERLRHQWVRALLDKPGHLIDGTKMPDVYSMNRKTGFREVTDDRLPFLFQLRDDPEWLALFNSDDEAKRAEAVHRLAEVQMDALTDYVVHHYESPRADPPGPAGGK